MELEVYMPPKRGTVPDPVELEYERYLDEHEKRIKAEAQARFMSLMFGIHWSLVVFMIIMLIVFYR